MVDEQRVEVRVRWRTGSGDPVAGEVRVYRAGSGRRLAARPTTVRTGDDGQRDVPDRPRTDTRWQARGRATGLGRGRPQRRPPRRQPAPGDAGAAAGRRAPSPRIKLPAQRHAVGAGPNAVITRSPTGVWNQMTGAPGTAAARSAAAALRYARINYWDYQRLPPPRRVRRPRGRGRADRGRARRHVHRRAAAPLALPRGPVRLLLAGSAAATTSRRWPPGNTSVFNCRDVVNRPGVRSPHSYGRAIDLNTWENPYRSQQRDRAERLVAVALAPAGGLALRAAPRRRDHGGATGCAGPTASATPSTSTRRGRQRPATLRPVGVRRRL